MSDNMSQEMIEAMLNGGGGADNATSNSGGGTMDQAAIDALLNGNGADDAASDSGGGMMDQAAIEAMLAAETNTSGAESGVPDMNDHRAAIVEPDGTLRLLSDPAFSISSEEQDILGEIGNMCMGASATAMYTTIGKKVTITTPHISIFPNLEEMLHEYNMPFILVSVNYTEGVEGQNILLLKESDAVIITDLMMGGEGVLPEEKVELDELHLSAISEIMNQMIGSAATSLSNIIQKRIDISPPSTHTVDLPSASPDLPLDTKALIRISFVMEIEGILKSELMQVMTYEFAKGLVQQMLDQQLEETEEAAHAFSELDDAPPPPQPSSAQTPPPPQAPPQQQPYPQQAPYPQQQGYGYQQHPYPQQTPYPQQPYGYPQQQGYQGQPAPQHQPVDVQPVQYQEFGAPVAQQFSPQNLDLLIDVGMNVTVELGKAQKTIKDILDLGMGSIIELDKLAGEPVEVLVNNKLIARGEVVVIEESYGVRITDIVSPTQRL